MNPRDVRTVLFDLDGTLCDTAPDLLRVLNRALTLEKREPVELHHIRHRISEGLKGMMDVAFGELPEERYWALRANMMDDYAKLSPLHGALFPGMDQVLRKIEEAGLRWGIVTNKPTVHTHALLKHLHLMDRPGSIVCADTLPVRKPAPETLWHACEEMGAVPEETCFIGDSWIDVQTGKAAGIFTVCAMYGYMSSAEEVDGWQADARIDKPLDLLDWLKLSEAV